MLSKLLKGLRGKITAGDTVICAVSGGADSMALLWGMYLLREQLGITLQAAHFNHGLRGTESDADAAFVQRFCKDYQIPLYLEKGIVTPGNKGLEAAAREARYRFFGTLNGKIATAHTADDNAETILMHLLRGTGLKGLGGITPVRGNVIRPMLEITRAEVLAFLEEYSITHVEDSSNAGDDFLRNRIRHKVLPLLLQENPKLSQDMTAMAAGLRQDEACLEAYTPETTDVSELRALAPALQSRAICRFLIKAGVPEPSRANIGSVVDLLNAQSPSARVHLPGGIVVERNYEELRVAPKADGFETVVLQCPGSVQFGNVLIRCRYGEMDRPEYDRFVVAPCGQMVVRSRRAGDEMRLMGGTKSLKKLFTDRKLPASERPGVPVIADDQGVLGVYGFGANLNRAAQQGIEIIFEKTEGEKNG